MSDIFDKISTLINAQLNDFLGKNPRSPLARIQLQADEAEKNPQRSAQSLRQRLEEAIEYEDELQARIEERMRAVVELDKLVDDMLRSGDEVSAERLQNQLNMKQQHLTIAESELHDHRLMTRHLMQELATLETALDKQERERGSQRAQSSPSAGRRRIPVDGEAGPAKRGGNVKRTILDTMSNKFDETRANLENMLDGSPAPSRPARPSGVQRFEIVDEEPDPRRPKPRKKDEPDMKTRLSRLSKPPEDD
ncbi:MAG: hypothetical protein OXG53_07785 [Chloroflexi bacterium]|nr:hypothetical protein [Chloroflexota bacterium]